MLAGKVAIPLHDPEGRLVGYAGADTRGKAVDRCDPELQFPQGRERKGVRLDFRPDLLLYNAHRMSGDVGDLIIASSVPLVWALHQCGVANAVATLGGGLSERQAELVASRVRPSGNVWIFTRGAVGAEAIALLGRVARLRAARLAQLPAGAEVSREVLASIFLW